MSPDCSSWALLCTWTTLTCYTGRSHLQLILRNWLLISRQPPLITGNLHRLPNTMKAKKCSVYFLDYKFICGCACMKSLQDLPASGLYISEGDAMYPSHIVIPQPDSMEIPIITHDVTTALKMLGVHDSPAGNSPTHVKHMVQNLCRPKIWSVVINYIENFPVNLDTFNCISRHKL